MESAFEHVADTPKGEQPQVREHAVKVEMALEAGIKTVHGKSLVSKFLFLLEKAVKTDGHIVEFEDVDNNRVNADLKGIKAADTTSRFKTEITNGSHKMFIFGINIRTTLTFSALKDRMMADLKPLNTYMKIHHGGFEHGTNWTNLGFFVHQHPRFSQLADVTIDIQNKIQHAWDNDTIHWNDDRKNAFKKLAYPNSELADMNGMQPTDIPIITTTSTIVSKHNQQPEIRTTVIMISTPHKFIAASSSLIDYLLLTAKNLTDYIPTGFKREDPDTYHDIVNNFRNRQFATVIYRRRAYF